MKGIQNVLDNHKHKNQSLKSVAALEPVAPTPVAPLPQNNVVDEFEMDFGDLPEVTPTETDTTEPNEVPEESNEEITKEEPLSSTETSDEPSDTSEDKVDAAEIRSQLHAIKDQIQSLLSKLEGVDALPKPVIKNAIHSPVQTSGNIIEGVFNGEKVVGPDGKEYAVPPNYASKSKLVEGDIMKLTIRDDGSFMYKQISPAIRKRIVGTLLFDNETQKWMAMVDGKGYKILTASVTFYKGNTGDEVVILVPEEGESSWGAVENIIAK